MHPLAMRIVRTAGPRIARRVWPLSVVVAERDRLRAECQALRDECERLRALAPAHDDLPIPPAHLRFRISADRSIDKFLGIGRTLFGDIKILAAEAGRDFESFHSILDFGCGCGRVARYLRPRNGRSTTATDIDPEAVAWCQENLGRAATFEVNGPTPPLRYADASFDFIYAISVFTHLPEDLAMSWLHELRRILRPDGLLVTSIIGEVDLRSLLPDARDAHDEFHERGFYYTTKFMTDGLPSFYGLSFHARPYIEAKWGSLFGLAGYRPQSINNQQTGIVLRPLPEQSQV